MFATPLLRLDGPAPANAAASCPPKTTSLRPVLVLYGNFNACSQTGPAIGLFPRAGISHHTAYLGGLIVPLALFGAVFVMVVRRLRGRVRIVAGIFLAAAGGYLFETISTARYAAFTLAHGDWQKLGAWAHDPYALRESLLWLGSGAAVMAGLWLLALAVVTARRHSVA